MYIPDWIIELLAVFILLVIVLGICAGCAIFNWNDGDCRICDAGHYEYYDVVGGRRGAIYLYKCDNCGYIMESSYYWN